MGVPRELSVGRLLLSLACGDVVKRRQESGKSGTSERLRAREYASKNSDLPPHGDKNDSWPETSRSPYRDGGKGSSRPEPKSAEITGKSLKAGSCLYFLPPPLHQAA